jgi:hypothetical protein
MANTVETISTGQVLITQISEQVIEVQGPTTPLTVEVVTAGPQGPAAAATFGLGELIDVNTQAKVAGSVLYFDSATSKWRGDDVNTVVTLTDGGAF